MVRLACDDVLPVMSWRRAFPGDPKQGKRARDFARVLLVDHPRVADILAVIAELFANAVCHSASGSPGGLVVLELRRWRRGVAVAVIDQGGPTEPVVRTVDETLDALAEGGRGLLTVGAYATWWCCRGDSRGRTVTAFFGE
jgi:hypothetical protein